jgi:predicted DNA-binding protein YlxM (UPF0122 family)
MSKITVQEYAKKYQISRQTVYNHIKKGLLESVEENDTTLVYDDVKEVSNPSKKDNCQKLVKKLLKRIDKLEAQLDKARDKSDNLILTYVDEMKALYLPKQEKKKKK